jgi:transposase
MDSVHVERLDHLGFIASVIKDVRLIGMVDARLVPDAQEEITPGEAVAGMILNGLGFANRPLSLTPQFFANTPLDRLCRDGVRAERWNRCKLGRTLDEVHAYGGALVCSALALAVCVQEGIDQRCHHLDTTSFSLRGDDVPESDEPAMTITHGYSTDHRPDLKPAVLERLVAPDGGVPMLSNSGDGKASDTQGFQERAAALLTALVHAPTPRYLVADATRYHEAKALTLTTLGLITRMPSTLKLVAQAITQALTADLWAHLDETTRDHRLEWCHDGMAQRWLVVWSQAALERAEASVTKAQPRAWDALETQRFHVPAQRVETPKAAHAALVTLAKSWRDHQVETSPVIAHTHDACKGRPTSRSPIKAMAWQIHAHVRPDHERIAFRQHQEACFVIGTTIDATPWRDPEVIHAYKAQAQIEGGFRCLKDPLLFVSSWFVKKPCRMQGLLMVMR